MPVLERKDVENSEEENDAGDENCGDQFLVHCKCVTRPVTQVTDDRASVQPHMNQGEKNEEEAEQIVHRLLSHSVEPDDLPARITRDLATRREEEGNPGDEEYDYRKEKRERNCAPPVLAAILGILEPVRQTILLIEQRMHILRSSNGVGGTCDGIQLSSI